MFTYRFGAILLLCKVMRYFLNIAAMEVQQNGNKCRFLSLLVLMVVSSDPFKEARVTLLKSAKVELSTIAQKTVSEIL